MTDKIELNVESSSSNPDIEPEVENAEQADSESDSVNTTKDAERDGQGKRGRKLTNFKEYEQESKKNIKRWKDEIPALSKI